MNPENKDQYLFDGQWVDLEIKKIKLRIKGVPISVNRPVYWSKYGATMKNEQGVFAIRLGANMEIRALEQWYRMNKAKNFTEFYKAISVQGLSMFNIIYADRNDTIFYINNALMPIRNPAFNWKSTVAGNTSASLWTSFRSINELPQYINPSSGYLFNTNHSSFSATASENNLKFSSFPKQDGWENNENNRSVRFRQLFPSTGTVGYEQFKQIKFDRQLPQKLQYLYGIDTMFLMHPKDHPEFADLITTFASWDKRGEVNSKGAAIFLLAYEYLVKKLQGQNPRQITKSESIEVYQYIKQYMMQYFGKTDLVLGDIQKLVRGDKEYPTGGLPDLLAPEWTMPYKDGKRKVTGGDCYVAYVRFPKNGLPIIETVNTYGASSKPDSPHFDDQVPLFLEQKTKPMTLDKKEVLANAKRIYHPYSIFK